MPRLFVGLELPKEWMEALTLARAGVEGAHWQRDDQLHLTLAFIGDVPTRTAHDIALELSRITLLPFDLALNGVGMFGKIGQPRCLWAGVDNAEPLEQLHDKISNLLNRMNVPVDSRRFIPHVTLARFRRGTCARAEDWVAANQNLKTPPVEIDHFTLFSSQITHEGAFYHAEGRFGSFGANMLDGDYDGAYEYDTHVDSEGLHEDWPHDPLLSV